MTADRVRVVELYALAQLHDVFRRWGSDHLRSALRQVRHDVFPRRLGVALVHVELAEDRREVGIHRPELGLVWIMSV